MNKPITVRWKSELSNIGEHMIPNSGLWYTQDFGNKCIHYYDIHGNYKHANPYKPEEIQLMPNSGIELEMTAAKETSSIKLFLTNTGWEIHSIGLKYNHIILYYKPTTDIELVLSSDEQLNDKQVDWNLMVYETIERR